MIDNFSEVETDKGNLRLYNSFSHSRLTAEDTGDIEETYDEFKLRRTAIKNYNKVRPTKIHTSTMLIPAMDSNGQLMLDMNGKIVFLGQTKGVTYHKNKEDKEEEHMGILEHIKNIKEKAEDEQRRKKSKS